MNRVIWKFPLEVSDHVELSMPAGARILTVQAQHGQPVLWALVDPDAPSERRGFEVRGTGHSLGTDAGEYVGTYQLHDGAFVGHVFESAATWEV